ncbi:MAG: helix-turn-helix domain-containing protein [Lachnospiraceae bacterium]|nr:helix-turn-helix domain-containing protein [Lachnospiraceae bacterium]
MPKSKYRVLVADDEYWSRENLRNLIDWESMGLDFLEPAEDGQEVLERIPQETPNILLSDINMPFLDGISLFREVQVKYPEMISIAVSGYDDFEKVKGTFVAGGMDYLLKPVGQEQLKTVLHKAIDQLETNTEKQTEQKKNKEKERKASSILHDGQMSAILSAELYGGNMAAEHGYAPVLFLKFHDMDMLSRTYHSKMHQMSYDIKRRILGVMRRIRPDVQAEVFCYNAKVNEFLICMDTDAAFLKRVANEILMEFPIDETGPITVVLRENGEKQASIGVVYREMVTALMTRPFSRNHVILWVKHTKNVENARKISRSMEKNILDAVEKGKRSELKKQIFEVSDLQHCDDGSWSLLDISQYVVQLTGILFYEKKDREMKEEVEEINDALRYARMQLNKESLFKNIQLLSSFACVDKNEIYTGSIQDLAERIHEDVKKNYKDHLTLSGLAEKYHVDASYISRTFSKQYGETMMAYITRLRVERAMELIAGSNHSLEEISFEVGYDDYNYFSRVFKKYQGLRPSEYRQQYTKEEDFK